MPIRFLAPTLLLAGASGCAVHALPETAEPATAAAAIAATAPDRPVQVVFAWEAVEGDARFSGEGVARIQQPYHARLDLFGPRGDTYLSAALIDGELRLPPGVQERQLPPPPLMWAVLGVVAPPADAVLVGTRETADRWELYYEFEGGILHYILEDGALRSTRWDGSGRRMSVDLRGRAALGLPDQAAFRDVTAAVELTLNLESVDEVDPFPPEIWTPGR
jgi:hypothetical protein